LTLGCGLSFRLPAVAFGWSIHQRSLASSLIAASGNPHAIEWAQKCRPEDKQAGLILTIRVAGQTVRRGEFGIEVTSLRRTPERGKLIARITSASITSIPNVLRRGMRREQHSKNFDADARAISNHAKIPYRLLCTATGARTDYMNWTSASDWSGI